MSSSLGYCVDITNVYPNSELSTHSPLIANYFLATKQRCSRLVFPKMVFMGNLSKMMLIFIGILSSISFQSYSAPGALRDIPPEIDQYVQPNVLFLLDDSGSMDYETLFSNCATSSSYASSNNKNITLSPNSTSEYLITCVGFNVLYYDPSKNYLPWRGIDSSSTPYGNQPTNAARINPYDASEGTYDLVANGSSIHRLLWISMAIILLIVLTPAIYMGIYGSLMWMTLILLIGLLLMVEILFLQACQNNDCSDPAKYQPITTKPIVSRHPYKTGNSTSPNVMLYFGTGRYLALGDETTTDLQAFNLEKSVGGENLAKSYLQLKYCKRLSSHPLGECLLPTGRPYKPPGKT